VNPVKNRWRPIKNLKKPLFSKNYRMKKKKKKNPVKNTIKIKYTIIFNYGFDFKRELLISMITIRELLISIWSDIIKNPVPGPGSNRLIPPKRLSFFGHNSKTQI